jgi:catechol 2,3-dioxygenase-like lactoylglutathione lyase family enzyme
MQYEGLDDLVVGIADAAAAEPFERLGLRMPPPVRVLGSPLQWWLISAGGRTNLFTIVLSQISADSQPTPDWQSRLLQVGAQNANTARALVLRVTSLAQSLRELATRGIEATPEELFTESGVKLGDMAVLPDRTEAVVRLALIERVRAVGDEHDGLQQEGLLAHSLDLKRLDHLAAAAPALEETTRFWQDVLDIPVWGEVVTATTVIRQMKVGDAIVELLGPAGPDSPLHSRPPGLSSMTAFEVPDLEAAVATARSAGFAVSEPATGALPGTRVSRIPAEELSGLGLQLLEYV